MTDEPLWLKNGEQGLSAVFERSGGNWLMYRASFTGLDLFIDVAAVDLPELIMKYSFNASQAWFYTVITNVELPYAGVSNGKVHFLATVENRPIEVCITGIKGVRGLQLEDGFNNAVARMEIRRGVGTRAPAVVRKGRELPEGPVCTVCGGPLGYMGTLGRKEWYRCRNCGMEFHKDASRKPTKWMPSVLPQTEGPRELPKFKGYTVDHRLREFRKVEYGKKPEFIPFSSEKGRRLMKEMSGYTGSSPTIHSYLTPERKLLDRLEQLRKTDPDGFRRLEKQIRQEIKNRERGKIKMFPDIGLVELRNVLKEAERMYR